MGWLLSSSFQAIKKRLRAINESRAQKRKVMIFIMSRYLCKIFCFYNISIFVCSRPTYFDLVRCLHVSVCYEDIWSKWFALTGWSSIWCASFGIATCQAWYFPWTKTVWWGLPEEMDWGILMPYSFCFLHCVTFMCAITVSPHVYVLNSLQALAFMNLG